MRLGKMYKEFKESGRKARQYRDRFDNLEKFVLFLGYPRSSHSLIGSLLDAHPDMVVSHEQDILRYTQYLFSRERLLGLCISNSEDHAKRGRAWTGYSYVVPGQYQGRFREMRIIGDKKGANTNRRLMKNPGLAARLEKKLRLPVYWIHVLRYPPDNIATIAHRDSHSDYAELTESVLRRAFEKYVRLYENSMRVLQKYPESRVYHLYIEQFIADPKLRLARLCEFLGAEPYPDYLRDCSSIVFSSPSRKSGLVVWPDSLRKEISAWVRAQPLLSTGYPDI